MSVVVKTVDHDHKSPVVHHSGEGAASAEHIEVGGTTSRDEYLKCIQQGNSADVFKLVDYSGPERGGIGGWFADVMETERRQNVRDACDIRQGKVPNTIVAASAGGGAVASANWRQQATKSVFKGVFQRLGFGKLPEPAPPTPIVSVAESVPASAAAGAASQAMTAFKEAHARLLDEISAILKSDPSLQSTLITKLKNIRSSVTRNSRSYSDADWKTCIELLNRGSTGTEVEALIANIRKLRELGQSVMRAWR